MKTVTSLAVAFIVASCGGGASNTSWTAEADSLPDGVTILSTHPRDGLRGVIKQNGEAVFFEARSVPMTAEEIEAGGEGEYENKTDARFFDSKGRTFSLIVGGDGPLDPNWAAESQENEQATNDERARHFALSATLAKAKASDLRMDKQVAATRSVVSGSPEWERITELSRTSEADESTNDTDRAVALSFDRAQAQASATTKYSHKIEAYKKPTTLWVGEHSSTWTRQLTADNKLYKQIITCNHGTCANSSNVKRYCTNTYFNRTTDIGNLLSASLDSYKGYCSTGYGLTSGKHVCNDDTRTQLAFIRNNAGGSMTHCGDSTLARLAPPC